MSALPPSKSKIITPSPRPSKAPRRKVRSTDREKKATLHPSSHSQPHCSADKQREILLTSRQILAASTLVEHKAPVPVFRGIDAPVSLSNPLPGFRAEPTTTSDILRNSMRLLLGERMYRFRLSTAVTISSNGSGVVNAVLAASTVSGITDFTALAGLFQEFFVVDFTARYMPVSRYNYPLTGVTATSVANLPLGVASLQHGEPAYANIVLMTDNYQYAHRSTGDPFEYVWTNVERYTDTVNTVAATGATPQQGWALCANAANYTGQIQFLTFTTPVLVASQALGIIAVHYDVLFRSRV